MEKHTQHSRGLLSLIRAKSANIDMLNRLASLITGRVNMAAAADRQGCPVGRRIGCVSYPDPCLLCGVSPSTEHTHGVCPPHPPPMLTQGVFSHALNGFNLHHNTNSRDFAVIPSDGVRNQKLWHGRRSLSRSDSLCRARSGCRCTALMVLNISALVGADKACRCAVCK